MNMLKYAYVPCYRHNGMKTYEVLEVYHHALLAQAVMLVACITEVPGSNLWHQISCAFFLGYLSSRTKILKMYIKLGHDLFLGPPIQFIIDYQPVTGLCTGCHWQPIWGTTDGGGEQVRHLALPPCKIGGKDILVYGILISTINSIKMFFLPVYSTLFKINGLEPLHVIF
jgi:hypothetical protein